MYKMLGIDEKIIELSKCVEERYQDIREKKQ